MKASIRLATFGKVSRSFFTLDAEISIHLNHHKKTRLKRLHSQAFLILASTHGLFIEYFTVWTQLSQALSSVLAVSRTNLRFSHLGIFDRDIAKRAVLKTTFLFLFLLDFMQNSDEFQQKFKNIQEYSGKIRNNQKKQ